MFDLQYHDNGRRSLRKVFSSTWDTISNQNKRIDFRSVLNLWRFFSLRSAIYLITTFQMDIIFFFCSIISIREKGKGKSFLSSKERWIEDGHLLGTHCVESSVDTLKPSLQPHRAFSPFLLHICSQPPFSALSHGCTGRQCDVELYTEWQKISFLL